MSETRKVLGYCPLGCGDTLYLADETHVQHVCPAGTVYCADPNCEDPFAVAEILGDRETHHVVTLTQDDFTVRHPLRERLGDELMRCALHEALAAQNGAPESPGRYRYLALSTGGWRVERLEDR